MVKGKARAAGSFLGGLANNPAIVIIALVLGGLFIFRDRISGAFGSLGEGLGDINITLPEIKLPEINLPEVTLPELPDFSGLFAGLQEQQTNFFSQFTNFFTGGGIPQPQKMVEDTGLDPLKTCECGASIVQDAFGNVNVTCKECAPSGTPAVPFNDAAIFAKDFPEEFVPTGQEALTPAQQFSLEKQGIASFLLSNQGQQFTGGGISFQGGSIFETPIENLSLSQIIDKFMVTASQAANIKAIASGFTPEEEAFLQGSQDVSGFTGFNPPAVSDPQFQGLTPQQIALFLTGGNISNF